MATAARTLNIGGGREAVDVATAEGAVARAADAGRAERMLAGLRGDGVVRQAAAEDAMQLAQLWP
jgi:hypothetical protein